LLPPKFIPIFALQFILKKTMDSFGDSYYQVPNTGAFYWDCVGRAVAFSLDRMPDQSWRRLSSDRPLGWVLEHLEAATRHVLTVRRHVLEDQKERWGCDKHLEVSVELRIGQSTYIFSVEMEYCHLGDLVERYGLVAAAGA
jgi:hypothetical protein